MKAAHPAAAAFYKGYEILGSKLDVFSIGSCSYFSFKVKKYGKYY
jgi:hypothetical protein